jgi:hypothetical protein
MGWTARIVISVIVILLVGGVVLGLYESTRPPHMHDVDEAIPVTSYP